MAVRKAETTGEEHARGEACGPPRVRERHLLTQYAVTRVLAEAASLAEATPAILRAIAENLDWDVGDFWQRDPVDGVLRCVDIWHQPGAAVAGFMAASRQRTFALDAGLPGRVWSSRTAHWIVDLVHDANFPRAADAARAGLRSAFAFPIRLGAEVLGVMEFFSRRLRQPDAELLEVFDALGSQIGQFIERK